MKLPVYVHPQYQEKNEYGQPQTWYWVREEDHFPVCRCGDRWKAVIIRDLINKAG